MSKKQKSPQSLFRPEVLELSAYHVVDASGFIKLDAMENPYSWPRDLVDEWLELLSQCQPNRYPDPSASKLKSAIRACNHLPDSAELLLGNGSDELIQILLMAVAGSDAVVLAPEPTFVMYQQIARCLGIRFVGVPLVESDFSLDIDAMLKALKHYRPTITFLAYPNNPTGNLFSESDILEILESAPGIVVLDEAYAPFAGNTFVPKLQLFDNLLVMRTISKLGLAGLRLGFLTGSRTWIDQLDKLRLPYNINVLTQISAEFALSNYAIFEAQTHRICEDRNLLFDQLKTMEGLTVYPSQANFILFRLDKANADQVFAALKRFGILIKNMSSAGGVLSDCLRVTVGTPDQNNRFINALQKILKE